MLAKKTICILYSFKTCSNCQQAWWIYSLNPSHTFSTSTVQHCSPTPALVHCLNEFYIRIWDTILNKIQIIHHLNCKDKIVQLNVCTHLLWTVDNCGLWSLMRMFNKAHFYPQWMYHCTQFLVLDWRTAQTTPTQLLQSYSLVYGIHLWQQPHHSSS
jgi:hypothetical protein